MPRPHILLIHWHDLGRHLGTYGAPGVESPELDRLAASGVRYDRAFAVSPLCSPARGALFTGRYPHANGILGLVHHGWGYRNGERTLPMLLGAAGYRTALIGLQHEAADPSRLGFDEVDECRDANGRVVRDEVADRAAAWIAAAARDDPPFLLTVGFREIHRPYPADEYPAEDPDSAVVPAPLPDADATRADFAAIRSAVRLADRAVGRILDALDAAGLRETTWVVFTTDHGLAVPGAKGTLTDAGTGVALIQRFPSSWGVPPTPTDRLFSHVDLVPTMLERLGLPVPDEVQGRSDAAWIADRSAPGREHVLLQKDHHDEHDPIRAVRTNRWKLVRNLAERPRWVLSGDIEASPSRRAIGDDHLRWRAPVELYDLEADPFERDDLARDPAFRPRIDELDDLLRTWQRETGDPLLDYRGRVAAG